MIRISDELNKVDNFRKNLNPSVCFFKSGVDLFENEEKNLYLNLLVVRSKRVDVNMKMIEVDPKGIKNKKMLEDGYTVKTISLSDVFEDETVRLIL